MRSSVDLPQPEGPISETNSPAATVREIPVSASTAVAPSPKRFSTPSSATAADVLMPRSSWVW